MKQEGNFSCLYIKIAEKKKPIQRFFDNVKGVTFNDRSVQISREKMKTFFDESLKGITNSLREIFKKKMKIKYILLLGGYASSKVLYDHVESQFGSQCEILRPRLPQEAVMKGAVIFGKGRAIASRKSPFTYDYSYSERFDASKHREDKKFTNSEGDWCSDLFGKMVEIDEVVGCGETKQHIFNLAPNQKTMRILKGKT